MDTPPPPRPIRPEEQEDAVIRLLTSERADYDQRIQSTRFHWWAWPLALLFGFFLFGFAATAYRPSFVQKDDAELFAGAVAICGGMLTAAGYGASVFFTRRSLMAARRQTEFRLTKANAELLKESIEEDFFTKLVKINFRYIDQYYLQTQEQANKSFLLSCAAAAVGFGIVMLGIVMMFFKLTDPAYVTTAVGTLSQFVSAVFFYLYNRTILKMGEYHEKLVLTQNISIALKIAESLPGEAKVASQQKLIDRLTQDVNLYLSDHSKPRGK